MQLIVLIITSAFSTFIPDDFQSKSYRTTLALINEYNTKIILKKELNFPQNQRYKNLIFSNGRLYNKIGYF